MLSYFRKTSKKKDSPKSMYIIMRILNISFIVKYFIYPKVLHVNVSQPYTGPNNNCIIPNFSLFLKVKGKFKLKRH